MRVIKFRGYDDEFKGWRYGWFTKLVEGVRRFWAIIEDNPDIELKRYYIHDEKTIGQFTGLLDKNGKEIYEGDIVYPYNRTDLPNVVVFQNASFGWIQYDDENEKNVFVELGGWDPLTVIGNIHEVNHEN